MPGINCDTQGIRGCPRCDVCGKAVRVRGLGENVWCKQCISEVLPFVNILGEGEYKGALREYREGLGSKAADFEGLRFDPFGDEEREALRSLDGTLKGCKYTPGDEVLNTLKMVAKNQGCSLSLLFHNIRSARGPGLEMFEAELRRWGIKWDIIGLAETWLDDDSEKLLAVEGYSAICASRKKKSGGDVALLLRGVLYTGKGLI